MSNSNSVSGYPPFHSKECDHFRFLSFWSKKATQFVDDLEIPDINDRVSHHDLFVQFINRECFKMQGKVDQQKRVKGSKHDDLMVPSGVIEFKLRSRGLESLPSVLRDAAEIFKRNDYIYFGYLRKRTKRDESKTIKIRGCIYYLYVIIFSKEIQKLNLKD